MLTPQRGKKDPILRRACDRCHAQKLSCQRNDSGPCLRCRRLGTACTLSPSLRNRRNRPSRATSSVQAPTHVPDGQSVVRPQPGASSLNIPDVSTPETAAMALFDDSNPTLLQAPAEPRQSQLPSGSETSYGGERIFPQSNPSLEWDTTTTLPAADPHVSLVMECTTLATIDDGSYVPRELGDPFYWAGPFVGTEYDELTGIINTSSGSNILTAHNTAPKVTALDSLTIAEPTTAELESYTHLPFSSQPTHLSESTGSNIEKPIENKTDGAWLRDLLEINAQLFHHSNRMMNEASLSETRLNLRGVDDNDFAPNSTQNSVSNCFDKSLSLTLRFQQTLRKAHGTSKREILAHTKDSLSPSVDPGTSLIVCSCYIRVLELFVHHLEAVKGALDAAAVRIPEQPNAADNSSKSTEVPPLILPSILARSSPLEVCPVLKVRITLEIMEEILDVMRALMSSVIRGQGDKERQEEAREGMLRRRKAPVNDISPQPLLAWEEIVYQLIRDIRRNLRPGQLAMAA